MAVKILDEYDTDCWITFVRESGIMHDPMLDFLTISDVTWHSAFIITRSGEERWINHNCQPVHDIDGRPLGRRGSNRDITIRKQTLDF